LDLAVAIDIETTGFGFKRNDRIVEIAGLVFDLQTGETVGSFETLINPLRNIPEKSTKIHGLTAAHLSMAPTFDEIAPWLAIILAGKTLIAHNALFDVNFLNAEFQKSNIDYLLTQFVCTCRLANNASLKNAALDLEIEYEAESHHGASYDANLCAQIFLRLNADRNSRISFTKNPTFVIDEDWTMPSLVNREHLGLAPKVGRKQASITFGVTQYIEDPADACYVWRLSEYLSDLVISSDELVQLDLLAEELGVTKESQNLLHTQYVRQLEKAALRDGLITDAEQEVLKTFSEQLNVPLEIEFSNAKAEIPKLGSLICVTGTSTIDGKHWGKSEISDFLEDKGFVFTDQLNKSDNVSLLLQESEGSQSSKVEKARRWGIPRMTIESFILEIDKGKI
jgi:DNA polymerase III subunit epsilon